MDKLMILAVEGRDLVATSPGSNIELGRVRVTGEDTTSHIMAARALVAQGFRCLEAEGYPRAGEHSS